MLEKSALFEFELFFSSSRLSFDVSFVVVVIIFARFCINESKKQKLTRICKPQNKQKPPKNQLNFQYFSIRVLCDFGSLLRRFS